VGDRLSPLTQRSPIEFEDRSFIIRVCKLICAPTMQLSLPPEIEQLVQHQIDSGKYSSAVEVLVAGVKLLEQQDLYQGRLQELQQEALVGWAASQRGEVVEGAGAIEQIRARVQSRHSSEV
jgi:antitoxin ParD1/3/4